ncbi:hypothetical protein B0H14DRAFT_1636336 [Mycena olivaceomarginata]|nr:hypothetical protein B0H14DRAFT_1636336 [Mycena olivaceomarginata]
MQLLRVLIPFAACSLIHSHSFQYRRGVQGRQTAVSVSSSVADSASPVSESTTSTALSSAFASLTPSSIQSTTSFPVSTPRLSISQTISTEPTSESTPTTAPSSTTQTTVTDSTTVAGKSLSTDSTATSPGPSIATALPATSPTGTTQASALPTPVTPPAPLKDCLGGTAACTFIPTSTARSNYAEMTPLSLPLENCNDRNVTVTGHFSGAVTVTDNWSVEVEAGTGFSLPGLLEIGLDVKTSFEKGKEIEMEQAFDYPIPPNTKAALVGSASFIGIFGSMEMNHRGSDSHTVNNVVYFKSAENPNPVALLMTIGCDQPWPVWNATPALPTSGASAARNTLNCFIIGLMIAALLT